MRTTDNPHYVIAPTELRACVYGFHRSCNAVSQTPICSILPLPDCDEHAAGMRSARCVWSFTSVHSLRHGSPPVLHVLSG